MNIRILGQQICNLLPSEAVDNMASVELFQLMRILVVETEVRMLKLNIKFENYRIFAMQH